MDVERVENVQEKCQNPALVTLTCLSTTFFRGMLQDFFLRKLFHKITLTTLAKNIYLFGEQIACYFDRAPQGYSRNKSKLQPATF